MPVIDLPDAPPEPNVRPSAKPREQTQTRRQPPYAVILHNDNINGFDYVVGVLRRVFGYGRFKALKLTLAAHLGGRSAIWTGTLELAELKADQVRSCGPDPRMKVFGAQPLTVTVEPRPG